jgi:hypothetical protein
LGAKAPISLRREYDAEKIHTLGMLGFGVWWNCLSSLYVGLRMSEKRLVGTADWGANLVKTEAWNADERILIESKQDVSQIVKANKYDRNENSVAYNSKFEPGARFRKVARIPNIVVDQLMREKAPSGLSKWNDKKYMKNWLNDPANKAWRTAEGWI